MFHLYKLGREIIRSSKRRDFVREAEQRINMIEIARRPQQGISTGIIGGQTPASSGTEGLANSARRVNSGLVLEEGLRNARRVATTRHMLGEMLNS